MIINVNLKIQPGDSFCTRLKKGCIIIKYLYAWLVKKATQLQISNTKRDLKILIDTCEEWKEKLVDEELFDPIMSQLISSMRGPLPKRDLVAEIFDPVLKNKKYKKLTKMAVQRCVDSYQDSHPK